MDPFVGTGSRTPDYGSEIRRLEALLLTLADKIDPAAAEAYRVAVRSPPWVNSTNLFARLAPAYDALFAAEKTK